MTPVHDKSRLIEPALALLEFRSIAAGIESADAMVKRAEVDVVQAGTVQPGNLLVLLGGPVAEVEEALKAGMQIAADALTDHIFLPAVAPAVVRALAGQRDVRALERVSTALGIVETRTVPAAIHAADAGIKGAEVALMEVRLADGLGGKGLVFFTGTVADVEAALEITASALTDEQKVRQVVIPQIHGDIAGIINRNTRFGVQLAWRFYRNDRFTGE
ncbi:MAG TPA: BMC domain-containing protein [Spirillospora sp.]|nr:BMC domain-containing protein [Spirillospora sp.]